MLILCLEYAAKIADFYAVLFQVFLSTFFYRNVLKKMASLKAFSKKQFS